MSASTDVLDAVAEYYRISLDDLRGKQRDKHIVVPRHVAMYLMRQETEASLLEIGQALGGRDHSTVLHGCEKICARGQREHDAAQRGARHPPADLWIAVNMRDLRDYRAFILDLDGVIYRGERLLPGAREFITWADATGRRLIFLSNNSFATPDEVTAKLARLDAPAPEGRVLTAGDAAARHIAARHPGGSVYVLGLPAVEGMAERAGLRVVWRDGIDEPSTRCVASGPGLQPEL